MREYFLAYSGICEASSVSSHHLHGHPRLDFALTTLVWAPMATIVFDARVWVSESTGLAESLIFPAIGEALARLWLSNLIGAFRKL